MKKKRKLGLKNFHSPEVNEKERADAGACAQGDPNDRAADLHAPDQRKVLSSLNYNKHLLRYLNADRHRQGSFCDLVIVVEGKEFQVHKVVVAVGSSYFHASLSKDPGTQVVTLEHVSSAVFQHLLNFLYTSEFLVLENEISVVLEAAKFLDIIDAVKVLAPEDERLSLVENESQPKVMQEPGNKPENHHKCPLCGRNFCYKKTLENHMDRAHQLGKPDVLQDPDSSTRKSTRRRKCPAKFEDQEDVESDSSSSSESYKSSRDASHSEDCSSEMNDEDNGVEEGEQSVQGENGEEEEVSEVNHEPSEDLDKSEERNDNPGSLGNFPDGLAPIVLEKSSRKNLKCPKCEKVFDRVGKYESHTRVHTGEKPFECDICNMRYSTKSNLTVHRKRHDSETELPRKDHKCPFCSKLHASRKTLVKHVKR